MAGRWGRLALVGIAAATVATACAPASPAVPGNPSDFAVNIFSGWVQRWNPCAPVHYRVNDALAPTALAGVQSAVAALSKGSGITFIYDGPTTYVPQNKQWNQPSALVISFARHNGQVGGSNQLAGGNQMGEGGFQSRYTRLNGKITSYKITEGYVVVDAANYIAASPKVRTATLLHELGHAVGLNHAHFATEVMFGTVSNSGAGAYSAGDLAGLAKVGRPAGCLK
jgi:hypothetical protein